MKIFLSLFMLFTFTLSARAAEDFCSGKSSCRKGYIPILKSGTYYAKGEGRTCKIAMDESETRFLRDFGNMSCGLISGPYVWSCDQLSKNKFRAWRRCSPDSGPTSNRNSRGRCALIGGVIMC